MVVSVFQWVACLHVPVHPQFSCSFNKSENEWKSCSWMSWVWLSGTLWSTRLSYASVLRLSTRFMSWSTMTALSVCFHHFTASAALLRNRINCISAPVLNNGLCLPGSLKCRKQLSLTWQYIPCAYGGISGQPHSHVQSEGFILFILSVFISGGLSIYLRL